jgi:hypothetical protein
LCLRRKADESAKTLSKIEGKGELPWRLFRCVYSKQLIPYAVASGHFKNSSLLLRSTEFGCPAVAAHPFQLRENFASLL